MNIEGWLGVGEMSELDPLDFASKQNQSANGFLESEKWDADTAEASKAAAVEGVKEMSRLYTAKGEKPYMLEG